MAWYNPSWTKRKKITIDNTKVAGTESNFPVLINLASDSDLSASARSDGFDILFTSSDEVTKLDHEIEKYVTGTGQLVAFVRVPSLSGSADTDLYMYYGNSGSGDQSNKTGVWDSNFWAVYHLKEDPSTAGANGILDSTSNVRHLTPNNMESGDLGAVKVGDGHEFGGSNEYHERSQSFSALSQITVSGWIQATNYSGASCQLVQLQDASAGVDQAKLNAFQTNNGTPRVYLRNDAGATNNLSWSTSFTNNQLYWAAMTWDSGTEDLILYLDGQQDTSSLSFLGGTLTPDVIRVARMQLDSAAFQYHIGKLDEIRISSSVRGPNWIETEYNNMNSPGTFYTLGAEQESGYANTVNTVASPGKVNTVDGANINTVNTV